MRAQALHSALPFHRHTNCLLELFANIFKNRLDSFWEGPDIIYDFRAQLHGTGSRSEIRIE